METIASLLQIHTHRDPGDLLTMHSPKITFRTISLEGQKCDALTQKSYHVHSTESVCDIPVGATLFNVNRCLACLSVLHAI